MTLQSDYKIWGSWKRDMETPFQLAVRTSQLCAALGMITPQFKAWYQVDYADERVKPLGANVHMIAKRIADDGDEPDPPQAGYYSHFFNTPVADDAPGLEEEVDEQTADEPYEETGWQMKFSAGGIRPCWLQLHSMFNDAPDESVVNFDIARRTIRAIRDCFGAEWCAAMPFDLQVNPDRYRGSSSRDVIIPMSWMIELSPSLARHVKPPPAALHEYLPDGSLFLTATYDTFETRDREHLAAAEDIFAVTIDPLNWMPG